MAFTDFFLIGNLRLLIEDSLPVPTGTIESISLKVGFVNLEILGVCFLIGNNHHIELFM